MERAHSRDEAVWAHMLFPTKDSETDGILFYWL